MTTIENTERLAILSNGRMEYAQRLCNALGDPSQWEYRGEMIDLEAPKGKCACGHEGIRFEFIIHRDKQTAIIGSTCICHFALINPAAAENMAIDYQKIMKKLAEQKQAAKKAAQQAEVIVIGEEYNNLRAICEEKYRGFRDHGYRVPWELWNICASGRCYLPKKYTWYTENYVRSCDQKRKIGDSIKIMKSILANA